MIELVGRELAKLKGWFSSAFDRYAPLFGMAAGLAVACLAICAVVGWMEHRDCSEYGDCLSYRKIERQLGLQVPAPKFGVASMRTAETAFSSSKGTAS